MVKLVNIVDIRTGRFHSEAEVDEKKAKYFVETEKEKENDDVHDPE